MSREELMELLDGKLKERKKDHDIAVQLGSAGVSPNYFNMYLEVTDKIKESLKV
ncbi:hypothetical protein ACFVQB_14735 [Paenibacillus sp. NPDC057886]|uniref:hypothetical protein n=1 Tax=Paenibacillus sp. NPDC057886 TaxID=3346270 RepID=UPI0036931DB2